MEALTRLVKNTEGILKRLRRFLNAAFVDAKTSFGFSSGAIVIHISETISGHRSQTSRSEILHKKQLRTSNHLGMTISESNRLSSS